MRLPARGRRGGDIREPVQTAPRDGFSRPGSLVRAKHFDGMAVDPAGDQAALPTAVSPSRRAMRPLWHGSADLSMVEPVNGLLARHGLIPSRAGGGQARRCPLTNRSLSRGRVSRRSNPAAQPPEETAGTVTQARARVPSRAPWKPRYVAASPWALLCDMFETVVGRPANVPGG